MHSPIDIIVKGAMVGDFNVGKSSIFQRYMFQDLNISPTVGVDFHSKEHTIEDVVIRLNLWDTAGQERFRSIVQVYARGVYIFFLVFDVSQRKSFMNLDRWLAFIRNHSTCNSHRIILIANKVDIPSKQWQVSKQDILDFASKHDDIHKTCFVTSRSDTANTYINGQQTIISVFHDALSDINTMLKTSYDKINGITDRRYRNRIDLHTPPGTPPSSIEVMTSFGFKNYSPSTETCQSIPNRFTYCVC